jgi:subtilisin family serine protease
MSSLALSGPPCRIGVFDTSPFPFGVWGQKLNVAIPWISPELNLRVHNPEPTAMLTPPSPLVDMREHGMAVASLAHKVAPDTEIHLYRVLDNYAQGDTYTLIRSLARFMFGTDPEGGESEPEPGVVDPALSPAMQPLRGVINLSMGVLRSVDPALLGYPDADITALQLMLSIARCYGLVIAAAAGNDSWGLATPELPQAPASYPFIVGVSASDVGGTRACFSNRGGVPAPGSAVIAASSMPPDGYAYWSGTSFATPLVSGLAARRLREGLTATEVSAALHDIATPPHSDTPNFRVPKAQ